jgi:hypothetical protein
MKFVPNAVSSKLAVAALKAQKHSPTLLFAGGVVGVAATVVLACRATLKVDAILKVAESKLEDIEDLKHEHYSENDRRKDEIIVRVQAFMSITKLYGPALLVGVASIAALAGSHNILTKRNAAITAAYAALDKGFKEYRARVVDDLGDLKDQEYLRGLQVQKVVKTDASGKKTQDDALVPTGVSPYGILFREGNPNWQRQPEYNYLFLRGIQNMANDRLQAKGFLLLNDVYDDLGIDRTPAGCVVGWLANGDGDGYVDFGIFDDKDALRIHDYITGREGELYLDFNVDGVVYEKI